MKTYEISSAQNETFKIFKSLLNSKGIVEHRQSFIFGKKAVLEVKNSKSKMFGLIVSENHPGPSREFLDLFENVYKLKESLFAELDIFGSKDPLVLVRIPEFREIESPLEEGSYLYVPFQDPGNVGAVLRSAAAFKVDGIILSAESAHPFHPRSSRAASGSLFHHAYFKASDKFLKTPGLPLIALDKGGESLSHFKFPKSFILVPGVEGPGLSPSLIFDFKVGIAIQKDVDSLNAPVAVSIALYQWAIGRSPV